MIKLMVVSVCMTCLTSCYSVQGVPTGNNNDNDQVAKTIRVVCTPEITSELLSRCAAVRPPQRWCMEETMPFNYDTKVKIYYVQIHPAELDRIISSFYEQPGVKQVTLE